MTARESIFEQLQRIPEDLIDTYTRLENWARWSRDRIKRGHCRSIEYRYIPERVEDDEARVPRIEWDSLDAVALHSVICEIPEKSRWLLHLFILHRIEEYKIRRILGIKRTEVVEKYRDAIRMVRNRARRLDGTRST